MPRYISFLRAINVGGHTVKMEELRKIFAAMGFSRVETFIASGNVIITSSSTDRKMLEGKIQSGLSTNLGFDVAAFIRTEAELVQIAGFQPFSPSEFDQAVAFNVAFLADPLDELAIQKLMALETNIDAFDVDGREVYWLCRKKQSESTFSNAVLEKTLGLKSTLRGMNTVQKLVAKYVNTNS